MALLLYDSRKGDFPATDPIISNSQDELFERVGRNFQDLDRDPNHGKLSDNSQKLKKNWVNKNVFAIEGVEDIFHNRETPTALGFQTDYMQSDKSGLLVGSPSYPSNTARRRYSSPHGIAFKMKYTNGWSNRINQRISDMGILYIHVIDGSLHFGEVIINGSIPGKKINTGFNINEFGKPSDEAYFRAEVDPADKAVLDANPNLYKMTGFYIIAEQEHYDGASHKKNFKFYDIKFLFDTYFDRQDNIRHVLPASEFFSNIKDQHIDGYLRID